ncbi:hypothetical protein V865_001441 [Kwoniella europaea PYCC6329]|uniref:Major facilitator superfamily (MFS) profile domain-containing protein n=1 Tax=Kwoniella europaea PYCC6329 TaxID=1423913 RepID=A0AAX4KBR9_9TREE
MHPDDKDLEISHIEGGLHTIDKKGDDAIVADTAAADYVDSSIIITEEENLRLRRKIYKHLLPVMCVAYITQSLDKGTLGSASIMGWQKDVGAVGQDYALTSTLLWVGIICGEPIVNQFVRKLPVAKVLGISIVIWSAWMTVVIALISFIAAVIVLVFLPDTPVQARWATKEEKVKYVERVRTNDQGIQQKVWRSDQAWEVLRDPLPWLLFGMMFIQSTVVGGLNTFNNLLIKNAFGFTTSQSLLLALPLAVFQVILYFLIGWLGTKTRQTVYCMVGYVMVNIAGSIVLITVAPTSKTKVGLLITFYLMQCCQATNPSMYAMLSRNVAGQTKKSVVYAIFFVGWAGGNALGPQLFQAKWASRYINSLYIHIGLYCAFIIDVLVMRWICVSRNKKRDALMQGQINAHAHAFEDKTDLQNIEFRYSY